MKKTVPILIFSMAVYCFCLLPAEVTAQGKDKLVAAKYPGGVPELNVSDKSAAVFYSKDAYEKVKSFYEQVYATAERDGSNPDAYWIKVEEKGNIKIIAKPPKDNYYVTQAIAQLRSSYLGRFAGLSKEERMKRLNDEELKKVIGKYEYLKTSFFSKTRIKDGSDFKGIEQVLYEKFFADPEAVRAAKMNELMEQYTHLIQEGRIEEATKVSERLNALSRTAAERQDSWDVSIDYLEELEKLAYPTKIVIDKAK